MDLSLLVSCFFFQKMGGEQQSKHKRFSCEAYFVHFSISTKHFLQRASEEALERATCFDLRVAKRFLIVGMIKKHGRPFSTPGMIKNLGPSSGHAVFEWQVDIKKSLDAGGAKVCQGALVVRMPAQHKLWTGSAGAATRGTYERQLCSNGGQRRTANVKSTVTLRPGQNGGKTQFSKNMRA